ncbi:Two pore calcium channel protein 1 [Nymphaea thermarum]|nr:Two pore calcium channel protein 1 [Nymphaea thermarum]
MPRSGTRLPLPLVLTLDGLSRHSRGSGVPESRGSGERQRRFLAEGDGESEAERWKIHSSTNQAAAAKEVDSGGCFRRDGQMPSPTERLTRRLLRSSISWDSLFSDQDLSKIGAQLYVAEAEKRARVDTLFFCEIVFVIYFTAILEAVAGTFDPKFGTFRAQEFLVPRMKIPSGLLLAEDGIGLPVEVLDEHNFDRTARLYLMINKINFLWSLNLFALIVLNFLEMPLWCSRGTSNVCNDRTKYYLGELPYLTPVQSLFFEGSTLFILILQAFLPLVYMGTHLFWKNDVNKLRVVVFLFILIADLVVDALYVTPGPVTSLPLRIAPYARVIIVILNVRELRACMLTLAGMISVFLDIMALWILFLLICSWLAYVIFEDTSQGKIFKSYGATLYQMFVLFTTSNNPDVWIPAYKTSRWYSLFFVLYVLLGVYFVTNLILAVVYDSFKDQLAKQVAQTDTMQKHNLSLAFKLIDDQKRGFIDKDQCIHLFEELTKYRCCALAIIFKLLIALPEKC